MKDTLKLMTYQRVEVITYNRKCIEQGNYLQNIKLKRKWKKRKNVNNNNNNNN